jgi:hypothetical protein
LNNAAPVLWDRVALAAADWGIEAAIFVTAV